MRIQAISLSGYILFVRRRNVIQVCCHTVLLSECRTVEIHIKTAHKVIDTLKITYWEIGIRHFILRRNQRFSFKCQSTVSVKGTWNIFE